MNKSEMIAKSSNIHTILTEFSNALKTFKKESNSKFKEIINISNSVKWEGPEANKFKQSVQASANSISQALAKSDETTKILDQKAAQWAQLLQKMKNVK